MAHETNSMRTTILALSTGYRLLIRYNAPDSKLFIIVEAREARPWNFALPYFVKGSELRNYPAIVGAVYASRLTQAA